MSESYPILDPKVNPDVLSFQLRETFGLICVLSKRHGYCYAKASWLASKLQISESQVSRRLKALVEFGMIRVDYRAGLARHIIPLIQKQEKKPRRILSGYIYLLECDGFCKIGKTVQIVGRIRHICTSLPYILRAVYAIPSNDITKDERAWHSKFRESRLKGEWFILSDEEKGLFTSQSVQLATLLTEAVSK